jgi:uncharacterized lipoprotein YajG
MLLFHIKQLVEVSLTLADMPITTLVAEEHLLPLLVCLVSILLLAQAAAVAEVMTLVGPLVLGVAQAAPKQQRLRL